MKTRSLDFGPATSPQESRWSTRLTAALLIGTVVIGPSGCAPDEGQTSAGSRISSRAGPRRDRGQALLDSVLSQLTDLPAAVDLKLTLPTVILDARTSRDRQDVMATLGRLPDPGDGPVAYNHLVVTTRNSRFRGLDVEPGDIVKYYVLADDSAVASEDKIFRGGNPLRDSGRDANAEEPDEVEVSWNSGMVREAAIDLTVAQVLSDNSLIVERGLVIPITQPAKIEIWRFVDDRMIEFSRRLGRYATRGRPRLAWEPVPDERALTQIVERLNQWLRQSNPSADWEATELLGSLPADLRESSALTPFVTPAGLGEMDFTAWDGRILRQAVWLRDISEWARGDTFSRRERAEALFDWTIRNVQLDDDAKPYVPWQTLVYGHGTAQQRAWVFAALCRQQNLDVVVLSALPDPQENTAENGLDNAARDFWLAALLDQGEIYLFDPRLGLAIPGPDGSGVATLSEALVSPEILAATRPADAADLELEGVVAQIVAAPWELSQRSRLLEAELTGENQRVLTVDVSRLAAQLDGIAGVAEVRLWDEPFRTLARQFAIKRNSRIRLATEFEPFAWRPALWQARTLHFQGKKETRKDNQRGGLEEVIDSHRDAGQLYTSRRVRPPERLISRQSSPQKRKIDATAKIAASYWLGLLSYDQGRYESAEAWLLNRTLEVDPEGFWAPGARYNLARTYEAMGRIDEAIELYEQDTSPQREGNRLRAKWLQERRE